MDPKRRKRSPARKSAPVNQNHRGPASKPKSRGTQAAPIDIQRDLRFRRDVVKLHGLGARALYELLVELGERRLCRTEIEGLVGYYAQLDPEIARIVGAGRLPPMPPLRLVRP